MKPPRVYAAYPRYMYHSVEGRAYIEYLLAKNVEVIDPAQLPWDTARWGREIGPLMRICDYMTCWVPSGFLIPKGMFEEVRLMFKLQKRVVFVRDGYWMPIADVVLHDQFDWKERYGELIVVEPVDPAIAGLVPKEDTE